MKRLLLLFIALVLVTAIAQAQKPKPKRFNFQCAATELTGQAFNAQGINPEGLLWCEYGKPEYDLKAVCPAFSGNVLVKAKWVDGRVRCFWYRIIVTTSP